MFYILSIEKKNIKIFFGKKMKIKRTSVLLMVNILIFSKLASTLRIYEEY